MFQESIIALSCNGGIFTSATGIISDGSNITTANVGTISGSAVFSPLCTGTNDGMRTQYLVLSSELALEGIVAGPIQSLSFQLEAGSGSVPDLKIKIGELPFSDLISDFDEVVFTDVYGPQAVNAPSSPGIFTFTFSTPYIWDGLSNILIDICHSTPSTTGTTPMVLSGTTSLSRCNQAFGSMSCTIFSSVNGTSFSRPVMTFTQKVYSNNNNCNFLISQGTPVTGITLSFTDFITESVYDVVTVYDGATTLSPVLGQFSGDLNSALPSLSSSGNQMLVTFISNGSIVNSGWSASYITSSGCTPSININGNSTFCSGTQITYTSSLQNEGTTPSIEWFVNDISAGTGITLSTSTLNHSDNIHAVLTSNAPCASPVPVTSNEISVSVIPSPTPIITSSTGVFSLCSGLPLLLDAGSGYLNYQWSSGSTVQTVVASAPGQYTVTVTDANGCTGSAGESIYLSHTIPSTPGSINGAVQSLCNTSGNVYTIHPVQNATSYVWSVTGGTITGGQGSTTISVDFFSFSNGRISVKAINGCGESNERTRNVSGKPNTPQLIIGIRKGICGQTQVYSIDPVSDATSYLWNSPSNTTIINGQGTTTITLSINNQFKSGNLSVKSVNACGNSNWQRAQLKGEPDKPASINGPNTVCKNQQGVIFTASPVNGATSYLWSVPNDAVIQSGQSTSTITVKFGRHHGDVKVRAMNDCGISSDRKKKIKFNCREKSEPALTVETSVYPNPASEFFRVNVSSYADIECTIELTDLAGRIIQTDHWQLYSGFNQMEYDCSSFSKGVYFLRITREGDDPKTMKVVVR